MFDWLKKVIEKIKIFSNSIDKYKKDTIIQSLPVLTFVNRAKKLIEQNKLLEAKKVLTEALELPQKDALVYKYLGVVSEKLGNFEEAAENYQFSAKLNYYDKNIWQRLGFTYISLGKYEQAIKSFENSDKVQSANTDTYTGWGMALMKLKKFEEAADKFETAMKINKYNFSAMFLCAVMEVKLEKYDKAEIKLAFLANVSPNESNTFEYARLKALKDDYESAIHYAQKSLEYNSNMLPSYILLGQIYAQKYDIENSLKVFNTAFNKELISQDLYLEWGMALIKFERYEEAKEKLEKAYKINNESIDICSTLALCLVLLGEIERAKSLLEDVMAIEPDNKKIKQSLGILAYKENDYENAIRYLRMDEDVLNFYYMGKCYEKLNNREKVIECFNSALEQNPKYLTANINYVQWLINQNEYNEAQRKLRKALKFYPDNIELLNLMFIVSYTLVKENICEYNIRETLSIAHRIENINFDKFKYSEQKAELEILLQKEN